MRSHVMLISLRVVLEPKLARWAFAGMNAQVVVVPLLLILETLITPIASHMHIQRIVMLLQLGVVLESKLAFRAFGGMVAPVMVLTFLLI